MVEKRYRLDCQQTLYHKIILRMKADYLAVKLDANPIREEFCEASVLVVRRGLDCRSNDCANNTYEPPTPVQRRADLSNFPTNKADHFQQDHPWCCDFDVVLKPLAET